MALVVSGMATGRINNYCIFGSVQPFDACGPYRSPCSDDAKNNDGWLICDYHLSTRFKMEKMVLPIPDADGTALNRTLARSLVNHKAIGDERILVPTKRNYMSVLNILALQLAEQYIFHIIYENDVERERICQMLEISERFENDAYKVVDTINARTSAIMAMVTPNRYCSRPLYTDDRIWSVTDENNVGGQVFNEMPPFLKNLISKAVGPEIMQIENEELLLRNCATCHITQSGLVADVRLYNPIESKYRRSANENVLQIENVLKFRGNANALQKNLNRYDPYSLEVPLMLGTQIAITDKTKGSLKRFTVDVTLPVSGGSAARRPRYETETAPTTVTLGGPTIGTPTPLIA